ncbi:MAG: ADP-ribosylglycohydrolase family protein [Muribaculaceae bacterium]|nr:ADP-ribosylglycohydrolase family protein [Muribaculaceae bacterium]
MKDILIDKARGCLVGGAAGDALGYAVEFSSLNDIINKYGNSGISSYVLDSSGTARFSDDTQMTLFTAEGVLSAYADDPDPSLRSILKHMEEAYLAWFATQTAFQLPLPSSWLSHIKDLWARRAPGNTCLSALSALQNGKTAYNDSKGCGAVMRIAPVGIYYAAHAGQSIKQNSEDIVDMCAKVAAEAARITHHHDLSTLSSVFVALVIFDCMRTHLIERLAFRSIISRALTKTIEIVAESKYAEKFIAIIQKSLDLANSSLTDREAIAQLGEGWVAEETVAIALFCVMRHIRDFEGCIVSAVNHDGDSDSTGAVAGNIIGAILGYTGIPEKFRNNLELLEPILSVADDLAGVSDARQINERYVHHRPFGIPEDLTFISHMKFTPENITELGPDDIFVFGSNLAGNHAGGAARIARQKFGAIPGQGVGLQGQSYAIPTMQGGVETIKPYVDDFIEFASNCDQNTFYVTRIGCGIAGFRDEEIAPLFKDALKLYNVRLPESFVRILLNSSF